MRYRDTEMTHTGCSRRSVEKEMINHAWFGLSVNSFISLISKGMADAGEEMQFRPTPPFPQMCGVSGSQLHRLSFLMFSVSSGVPESKDAISASPELGCSEMLHSRAQSPVPHGQA